jgi:phospholipid/cholesterol/gamma-HCH transport system substrate-binding protein
MRLRRLRTAVPAAIAAVLVLSSCSDFDGAYDLPLPGSPVDADDAYEVKAEFTDILNVVPRSPVMVDDVTVGEVTDVERVGWHAEITMRVREDVVLPDNSIAEIRQVSLLGEKYVALEAPPDEPSQGRLDDGETIELASTGQNPEVEEVLGALSMLLSGGGVGQLATITEELNNVMSGRTDRLRSLLGNLENVVGALDEQKADIVNALDSMNNLTATLNRERETIQGALDVAGPALEVLADQHDELIGMLGSLDRLGAVGTRVIRASKDDLLDSLRHLSPILGKLAAAGDSLAPGLNLLVSFPFPKEASEVVQGDYANTSIRLDVNLENLFKDGAIIPGVPGIENVTNPVGEVVKCLTSGRLDSAACKTVLRNLDLLPRLTKQCKTMKYKDEKVCRMLGGSLDDPNILPDLPGLLGLSRMGDALTGGPDTGTAPAGGVDQLLGGAS